ncbi:MAG: SUMF1/EgtB/PvdO family nonheme iron enzyme [Steroidobacteraceae bacterium]
MLAAVLLAASAAIAPAAPLRDCTECPELVQIAPGTFTMGADIEEPRRLGLPEYWATREQPRHAVRIGRGFAIGRYEATRGEFAVFARETGYSRAPGCWHFVGSEWLFDESRSWRDAKIDQTDAHPVTCVNWHDAQAYLQWLSQKAGRHYRLARRPSGSTSCVPARYRLLVRRFARRDLSLRQPRRRDDPGSLRLGQDQDQVRSHERLEGPALYRWVRRDGTRHRDGGQSVRRPWPARQRQRVGRRLLERHAPGAPVDQSARLTGADCGLRVMKGQGWTAIAASTRARSA